jgi:hypothetical protein
MTDLTALESSVEKWFKVVYRGECGIGSCALCIKHPECRKNGLCPIVKAVGDIRCRGTSYYDFVNKAPFRGKVHNYQSMIEAKAMYRFLEVLLIQLEMEEC